MIEQNNLDPKIVDAVIYNYKKWIVETTPDILYAQFSTALTTAGYTVLNHIAHHFPVKGYTCLWLLAESHLAIHTFPEKGKSYIELSGCNQEMNSAFERLVDQMYPEKL